MAGANILKMVVYFILFSIAMLVPTMLLGYIIFSEAYEEYEDNDDDEL